MRRGWSVAGAMVLGAIVIGGLAAGCEKHRERVKVVEVRPEHDRDVHNDRDRRTEDRDRDRRDQDRDRDRRNRDGERETRKEPRRDN